MSAIIFRSLEEARGRFGPCALTIGNFDGVHIAHQVLIRAAVDFTVGRGLIPAVLTFDPHPAAVVAPERVPELICPLEEKLRLLGSRGAQRILVLPFTREVAQLSPAEFVSQILVEALETKAVFVGENFRFGHRQAGHPETLRQLANQYGFVSQFLKPIKVRGEIVSSSLIRQYLKAGNVSRAGRLLNRCFSIHGPVVSGHGLGSKQTVPTLNLRPVPGQVTPRGVYITETLARPVGEKVQGWPSITNVGVRPTFGGDELTIETFLLRSLEGADPERIEVQFRRFVRAERQFPTPEALKQQILFDVARAESYWRRLSRLGLPAPSIY